MRKITLSIAFLLLGVGSFAQSATPVTVEVTKGITLAQGTVIKVAINKDISGKEVSEGQKIDFTTTEDIIQSNTVVLRKGLKVVGTVTEAAKSKGLGKKGKLSFSIDYLYLDNGKVVKLKSDVSKSLNGSGAAVVATAVILSPLALFVHGKNAKYEKGDVFDAYVDETVIIE